MPYIGKSPTQAVRQKYQYTATASQTTFSGSDANSLTLAYTDENYIDVTQNGVMLKGGGNDYTATTGTSVVLATGATADDVIEIIVYDVFAVADHVKKSGDIMTGQLQISTTDNSAGLLLESSDADANDAPIIDLYRNSASPADNDDIGQIKFSGQNDAGEKILYASMFAEMPDVSDGTENGAIAFNLETDGALQRMNVFGTDENVFNTNGRDIDFRVESDSNTHMIFVDGGSDHVNIGTSSDLGNTLNVNGDLISSISSNSGNIVAYRSSESDGDFGGYEFHNHPSDTTSYRKGAIYFRSDGNGFGRGDIVFCNDNAGDANNVGLSDEKMRIRSDGTTNFSSCTINTSSTTVASRGSRFAINQGNASGFAIAIDNVRNDTSSSGGILITNNETSGTFDLMSFLSSGDSEIGSINTNNSSTSFNTSSDYRLKENVVTDWDATTRLKQLKPSRFNFIADADTTVDGFLAHEVSSIVPEAITGEKDAVDEDGNIKTQKIDQSKLVPLLTKALQEAISEIDTLKEKVKALESK